MVIESYFPVEPTKVIRGQKDYAQFALRSGTDLVVIQNGLSIRESDKVLGFRISGRVLMVILQWLKLKGKTFVRRQGMGTLLRLGLILAMEGCCRYESNFKLVSML